MESLSDKLKAFGALSGTDQPSPMIPNKNTVDISDVIDGKDLKTPFGNVFLTEQHYPFPLHSTLQTYRELNFGILSGWAGKPELESLSLKDFLFLDVETNGLARGPGTFSFLIGLGYWGVDGFIVKQLFMRDPDHEQALLVTFAQLTADFKAMISFNGNSFDLPLLNNRHVLNDIQSPLQNLTHVDLLPLARRLWRNRLPSRAFKELEEKILGVYRNDEDVPGALIPEFYLDYLWSGDARPLKGIFYHNAQDLVSLGCLFFYISDLLTAPLLIAPEQGLDLIAIGRLYEDLGQHAVAIELYRHSLAQGLPLPFYIDTLKRFAQIYKQQSNWIEAIGLWKQAAEFHQVDACVELAKWLEHHEKDFSGALGWVQTAITYLPEIPSAYQRRELKTDLEKRASRLQKKAVVCSKSQHPDH